MDSLTRARYEGALGVAHIGLRRALNHVENLRDESEADDIRQVLYEVRRLLEASIADRSSRVRREHASRGPRAS